MNTPFLGPRIVFVTFLTLVGAFGLNLSAGQFFSPLHETYDWSLTTLSLAVSLNMLTWGIFQPIIGRMIDRFGPKPVIAGSAALMGVAFLLCSTITQIWQFFVYYGILTAVGFAGCGSMANSVLVSRWYVQKRAIMLARSSMGMNIGQLLLLPLTGILVAYSNFRIAFVVLGLIMLLIIVPAVLLGTKNRPQLIGQTPDGDPASTVTPLRSAPLSEAIRSREFWLASLAFVTCGYSLYMVTIHLPKFAADLGGGLALGGRLLGISAAASAVSMWITGQFSKTYGKRTLLIWLYTIRAAALAWLAVSTNIWQLYVFAILYGISSMPIIPLVTGIISDRFGANALGSILGSTWLLHQIFAAVGVFLGGYLRAVTGSYTLPFWTGAIVLIMGTLLTAALHEPPIREQTKTQVAH
ncbi:MFS transporter [Effusibacillus dendaii]|uniref:MFS transporter n=1 Tax=Effusibacillus dendaii TaxID=2743772 RepID=A0A7I8DAE1_9BACL|nr:MFS transporter [Effusibacillus dendaii]BCJ87074.1 MFS transporter [Effusibacillus dendaii]